MRLWVAGGRQSRDAGVVDRNHESLYGEAVVVGVDTESGESWPVWQQKGPGLAAKGIGGRWVALPSEAVKLSPEGEVEERWSSPFMNDNHHVVEGPEGVVVVATGADGVVSRRGGFQGVLGQEPPAGDLRGTSQKPHASHPNHLVYREEPWVTRLVQRDLLGLESGRRLGPFSESIHDGVVVGEEIWVTVVTGKVEAASEAGVRVVLDVSRGEVLGWCRGLAVDADSVVVGFSRLRATKWRKRLAWVSGAIRGEQRATSRATHLVVLDRSTGQVRRRIELEPLGIDAVFGLEVAPC